MSLNGYQWLIRTIIFRVHLKLKLIKSTDKTNYLDDRFVRMGWFLIELENNARKYCRHREYVFIDETLLNFFNLYRCDFKVYTREKPGHYELLFWLLTDAKDRYASRIIPYVTPPTNNLFKREILMNSSKKF